MITTIILIKISFFSYDPQRSSAKNVSHLLASDNKFVAPTTFPDVHNCETYADEHGSKNFIEILFLCILVGGASFGNENYMAYGCGYELFTVVSIPLNLIIISISWILSKTKDGNKKT